MHMDIILFWLTVRQVKFVYLKNAYLLHELTASKCLNNIFACGIISKMKILLALRSSNWNRNLISPVFSIW